MIDISLQKNRMRPDAPLIAIAAALALSTTAIVAPARAAAEAPDAMIERVVTDLSSAIGADPAMRAGDRAKIAELVEHRFLPYIDFYRMTSLAVGRFWRQATPEQQQRLVAAWRDLAVHAYADALAGAADAAPVFEPLRVAPGDLDVEVRSRLEPPGAAPRRMAYRLARVQHDFWRIYDIEVTGGWLVEMEKPRFNAIIQKGGIDALIATLHDRNRQWESAARATARP